MTSELGEEINVHVAQAEWVHGERLCIPRRYCHLCDNFLSGFKQRLPQQLEDLGDAYLRARRDDDAIRVFFSPVPRSDLARRSPHQAKQGVRS